MAIGAERGQVAEALAEIEKLLVSDDKFRMRLSVLENKLVVLADLKHRLPVIPKKKQRDCRR
jgi:hypothetical protein